MITQDQYETFRDNINTLILEYRDKFSLPVITDSKKYEETYRKRFLGMSKELGSMIDHVSGIVVDEFGRPYLLFYLCLIFPVKGSKGRLELLIIFLSLTGLLLSLFMVDVTAFFRSSMLSGQKFGSS